MKHIILHEFGYIRRMDQKTFNECLICLVKKLGLKRFRNHSEIARAFFPDEKGAVNIWRSIRLERASRKRRNLTVFDILSICSALDIEPSTLMFKVEHMIADGWQPEVEAGEPEAEEDEGEAKPKPIAGRAQRLMLDEGTGDNNKRGAA